MSEQTMTTNAEYLATRCKELLKTIDDIAAERDRFERERNQARAERDEEAAGYDRMTNGLIDASLRGDQYRRRALALLKRVRTYKTAFWEQLDGCENCAAKAGGEGAGE